MIGRWLARSTEHGVSQHGVSQHGVSQHGVSQHGVSQHSLGEYSVSNNTVSRYRGHRVSVAEIMPRGEEFERTPPHDLAAEQCVLGGMMLSKDAISDVLDVIRAQDYYRPAHQIVHDVILDLYGRGEPADAVTVAAELTRNGDIGRMGGAPYLHTLIASVPTAANAGYYARIVRERAILRRLVEVGTRIVQLGYAGDGDADDLVDRAEAEIYGVTDRRVSEDYLPLSEIMPGALDEIEAIGSRGGTLAGVPTGFADLDALTNGLHPGQMVVIAARPAMGKSALALDVCRSASVKSGMTSVLFSLEMSRNEITMRLLSAEARVPLHAMRTGQLGEDDWTRLARRMSEVVDAPLFIDDSPNMSMMEIRSKCRRLKQRNDLRLVVIDYLQLMSSPKRVENRQQEVSELSRSLKLLAKELNVPVVALAQLNRGPEMRTDKRPLLADLRESGCLTAATRVVRADTNEEVALADLLATGERDIPVWALDERLKYVSATMSHVFPTGRKETFALRLASGRQIEATGNHRFLTPNGWIPLAELSVGSRVAVPRSVPPPAEPKPWAADRIILLAHLLGDGSFVKRQPLRYASVDEANLSAVARAAEHFGVTAVRDEYPAGRVVTLRLPAPYPLARGRRNPIAAWLDELGLLGLRSHEKFVPPGVFQLPGRPGGALSASSLGDGRIGDDQSQWWWWSHLLRFREPSATRRCRELASALRYQREDPRRYAWAPQASVHARYFRARRADDLLAQDRCSRWTWVDVRKAHENP